MRNLLLKLMLISSAYPLWAQVYVPDATLERDFNAQVKSVEEFMNRFNGDTSKPGIPNDSLTRRNNIISLFDYNMSQNRDTTHVEEWKRLFLAFIDTALSWDNKLCFDSDVLAEAQCQIMYNKRNYKIKLFLQREKNNKGDDKWAIVGVTGLSTMGVYGKVRTSISPVEHEIHFISLQDFFRENPEIIPSLRSNAIKIDELSFFFGMCVANAITFQHVEDLTFHFLNVPNYVFLIKEIGRSGTNSGWLITKLMPLSDTEKEIYKKKLYGLNY